MDKSKESWDQRWHEKATTSLSPDPWLERALPFLPKGSVLDLACGRGRNALYLAEQGFSVTAVDNSRTGLKLLRQEAARRHLTIDLLHLDLEGATALPTGPFDVVIDFFYLQRSLYPYIKTTVRPGGVVVLRTFSNAGDFTAGMTDLDFHLDAGELLDIFTGWEVLRHEEGLEQSKKGGGLAGIVARKPLTHPPGRDITGPA
jgi:SAM-dependent methyltransferase